MARKLAELPVQLSVNLHIQVKMVSVIRFYDMAGYGAFYDARAHCGITEGDSRYVLSWV